MRVAKRNILSGDEVRQIDQRDPEIERLQRELARIYAYAYDLENELKTAVEASQYTRQQKDGVLKVIKTLKESE